MTNSLWKPVRFAQRLLKGLVRYASGGIYHKGLVLMQPSGFYNAVEKSKFDRGSLCWMYRFEGDTTWYSEQLLKVVQSRRGDFIVPPVSKTASGATIYDLNKYRKSAGRS